MSRYTSGEGNTWGCLSAGAVAAVIVLLILVGFTQTSIFGFAFHEVSADEIGVKIRSGAIEEILPPGVYTAPFEFFTNIHDVSVEGIPFTAYDAEVLVASAAQAVGVQVSGTVFRPRDPEVLTQNWGLYRNIYLSDEALQAMVVDQASQAMKTCVGQRTFEEAAVGADRNDLRVCIDAELDDLLSGIGLTFQNVVVPNIEISSQARSNIDAITEAQQQAERSIVEVTQVYAQSLRDLAAQQAQIRVTQGAIQEGYIQQATAAALEQQAIEAQRGVIQAQLENERYQAEVGREIAAIQLEIDRLVAQADTAEQEAIALIISANPRYAQFLRDQLTADALRQARLVYLTTGTNPLQIIGDDDVMLSLDVSELQSTPGPVVVPTTTPNPNG